MQENSGGWVSDSSILCYTSAGRQVTLMQILTVGKRSGSLSQSISYSVGQTSGRISVNRAGTGSASVTIVGGGLELATYTASLYVSATRCEASGWESETSVRCLIAHGVRGTRRVVISSGNRGASATQGWSIDLAGMSMVRQINCAGTGSASVTVHGASMGLVTYTGNVRGGHTGCEATEWESETSVRCLAGHGVRGTRRVVMTAGEIEGSASQGLSVDASSERCGDRAGVGDVARGGDGA